MHSAALTSPATLSVASHPHTWTIVCGSHRLELGRRTLIMGVVNVTPDSFSDGGQYRDASAAVEHALQLIQAGADVLDIGGESTRPGAEPVAMDEELRRILPVIEALAARARVPLSIDTSKAAVARAALAAGAHLVNDITALRGDPAMAGTITRAGCPVILMHMPGTPRTMQQFTRYDDVVAEVRAFLSEAIARATAAGIPVERTLIDPGIGFGKTPEQNLTLVRELPTLASLGRPVVLGVSRKAFIGHVTGRAVEERLWGTAGAVAIAAWQRAAIVRVHDVAAMRDVVRIADALGGRAAA